MTNDLTFLQQKVLSIVSQRPISNPITGKGIAEALKIKEVPGKYGASMRAIIHALRVKGYPVCASGRGYYWPKNDLELSAFIHAFKIRVLQEERAVNGLEKSWDKVPKYKPPTHDERTMKMFGYA
jgi:hypothetical protein